jgi:hypothetical protein
MASTFLTAEWRKLIMANYIVAEDVVRPYLPVGTCTTDSAMSVWWDFCSRTRGSNQFLYRSTVRSRKSICDFMCNGVNRPGNGDAALCLSVNWFLDSP